VVVWSPESLTDIGEAWSFIAADNEAAADRVVARLTEAANRLDRFPGLGRPGPEIGTRQFFVPRTPFKPIYRAEAASEILLLRVFHTSRKWPRHSPQS
jgi:toxin ParE1/3/4